MGHHSTHYRYPSNRKEERDSPKYVNINGHSSPKLETAQRFINRLMDKQTTTCSVVEYYATRKKNDPLLHVSHKGSHQH